MNSDAIAKLAYADDAEIKQIVVCGLQPARHARVGFGAAQFGRDIGIEQKALAHARSTGREEVLLRLKSRSSPFQGEASNNSTRLLRPGGRWYGAGGADTVAVVSFSSRASRALVSSSSVFLKMAALNLRAHAFFKGGRMDYEVHGRGSFLSGYAVTLAQRGRSAQIPCPEMPSAWRFQSAAGTGNRVRPWTAMALGARTVNVAGEPLKVTRVAPARSGPRTVTDAPTLPTAGTVFTKGPRPSYVKGRAVEISALQNRRRRARWPHSFAIRRGPADAARR